MECFRDVKTIVAAMKAILVLLALHLGCGDAGEADRAFSFTNFKIKLKSDHGVIDRRKPQKLETTEVEIENTIPDLPDTILVPKRSVGPSGFGSPRQSKAPMVFILNERFENPKFVSRHPRRKKIKSTLLPVTNGLDLPREKRPVKQQQPLKQKLKNFKSSGNHANILNTNFRFAYLKRIKQKLANANIEQSRNVSANGINGVRRSRKVKRVRKKLVQ